MNRLDGSPGEEAWRAAGEFLARDLLLLSRPERADLLAAWKEIRDVERGLDDRLTVGLVGGTGVGKSTLINALAGDEISRSGDRRPTTDRVVAYRHRETEIPPAFSARDLSEPEVIHENAALERVVVLDFPDFDSVEEIHHEIIERHAPHLDVLMVVVDDVKYADGRLFDLLKRLPQSDANLHGILNKVDRLELRYPGRWRPVADEILADFAAKLESHAGIEMPRGRRHAISARNAFLAAAHDKYVGKRPAAERAAAGPDPAGEAAALTGDFPGVVRVLEGYRLEKRRRAAKELNVEARKEAFFAEIRRVALDPARAERIGAAAGVAARRRAALERILAGISAAILRPEERRRIVSGALRRGAAYLGFPIDALILLAGEMGRFRRRGGKGAAADLSAKRVADHYRPCLEAADNLIKEVHMEAGDLLPEETLAATRDELAGREALAHSGAELGRRLAEREEGLRKRSRFWNHALPLLAIAFFLWSLAYPAVKGAFDRLLGESTASWGAILKDLFLSIIAGLRPSFIVNAIVTVALAYLVTALFTWIRQVSLHEQAITAAEGAARERVAGHCRGVADRVLALLGRWRGERDEIERMAGGSGTPGRLTPP